MNEARANIRFFIDKKEYAGRNWHNVPRVGDEIMLGAGKTYVADSAGKAAFRVIRVVWGTEGPDDRWQCVNVELELAPDWKTK